MNCSRWPEHFANHLRAFYGGNAHGDVTVFVHQQDLVKLYCRTALDVLDVMDEQLLAGLSLELLALNFYDYVHCCNNNAKS